MAMRTILTGQPIMTPTAVKWLGECSGDGIRGPRIRAQIPTRPNTSTPQCASGAGQARPRFRSRSSVLNPRSSDQGVPNAWPLYCGLMPCRICQPALFPNGEKSERRTTTFQRSGSVDGGRHVPAACWGASSLPAANLTSQGLRPHRSCNKA